MYLPEESTTTCTLNDNHMPIFKSKTELIFKVWKKSPQTLNYFLGHTFLFPLSTFIELIELQYFSIVL